MGRTHADSHITGEPDRDLLVALAAGNEEAFAVLYDRFATRLFRTALSIAGPARTAEAEDAVQDVFVSLVSARQSLVRIRNLTGYLLASVHRATIRRLAAGRAVPRSADPATLDDPELGRALVSAETAPAESAASEALEAGLAALPPEQRAVVALKIDGGLTFAEVATALGIPSDTAASRYRYALEKLRMRLKEQGFTGHGNSGASDVR